MRTRSLRPLLAAISLVMAAGSAAQPGSGTRWEVTMQMPGMDPEMQAEMEAARKQMEGMEMPEGMQMPQMPQMGPGGMTQKMCLPKDTDQPPPAEEGCKLLEQRSSGNHHFVKMQCREGLMELDQTRTASTMNSHMKMTDPAGEVTEMNMQGKALGDCDYTAEVDAQRRQVAAMQKQADTMKRQGEQQMKAVCDEAVQKMQGVMFGGSGACAARKAEYCSRLQTVEGYQTFSEGIQPGMEQIPEYAPAAQLKVCGLTEATLVAKLCPQAASAKNLRFVGAHCPAQRPQLCAEAMAREEFWYISNYCEAEREKLIATQCAGRKYSSQIPPKYRDFCTGALGADLGAGADGQPVQPADPVQQGVKKGLDGLKKIFGN